jgi:CBS domain containing-hemolysin-like protein
MEIAYISSNRLRIELDKKQGYFASGIIDLFISNPGKFLTTMLVGNNIALVAYGLIMANILKPGVQQYFHSPVGVLLVQTILSTLLILITAEFLPKLIFRSISNTTLKIFAVPAMLFYILFYPITSFITYISDSIINRIHKPHEDRTESQDVFNKIDLIHLINETQDHKAEDDPPDNDLKLFQNALDFSSVRVRDCMVPRTEIVALEISNSTEELQKTFVESGFSKILIYKALIDNMVGYVTSKSLFKKIGKIEESVIEIEFVPETMYAHKLLEKFIQTQKSVAVVVDEFGGVSGMVTIEDIIEEIFGEIEDEHDTVELIEKKIDNDEFIFSGRLEIDYLNDKYQLGIPDSEDYDTLAGFIVHHYENIPKLNERIITETFEIKILKATKTKIDLVNLHIIK